MSSNQIINRTPILIFASQYKGGPHNHHDQQDHIDHPESRSSSLPLSTKALVESCEELEPRGGRCSFYAIFSLNILLEGTFFT